jgi:hypothetical protein
LFYIKETKSNVSFFINISTIKLVKVKRMALWGISTTTETADNNYAIPKHLSENDRNNTPWNCFADVRGWVYRRYHSSEHSGLSTGYYDEVLVPVTGLNTTGQGGDGGSTGLGLAAPVVVFFEDPNKSSRITVAGGGTAGITTGTTGYVHVVFNELVFAGAGATVNVRTFDANGSNESASIVAYATSSLSGAPQYAWVGEAATHGSPDVYTNYNGQITNRVAFAFTAPGTVLSANVNFLSTTINSPVSVGGTILFVADTTGVVAGVSSVSVVGLTTITNRPIVAVGSTFVTVGTAFTVASVIGVGTAVNFSTRTNSTVLKIDVARGFVGVVTDGSGGTGVTSSFVSFGVDPIRNVGGAGTVFSGVGIGTTTLTVTA